ncbi:unnamed protein product [Rotaria sp. Silwood1]|nr:unnamed protein product [Rotaria sp. Silwood1]
MKIISDEIKSKDSNDNDFETCCNKYRSLLNGEHRARRKYENFVFIQICEILLYYIEKIDLEKYFPSLNKLMIDWKNLLMTQDGFEPKVIHVFRQFEEDLKKIVLSNVTCRIGFIGKTSVGKTSILYDRRRFVDKTTTNSQTEISSNIKPMSPIRVGKSTLCLLEFDHKYINGKNVIFVDIEGSTDEETDLKSGNYLDETRKVDCDLYILVCEHQFKDIYKYWYDYIVDTLDRTCWFVRNKIDDLFLRTFQQDVGQDFNEFNEIIRNQSAEKIIRQIRESISYDRHRKKLSNLYLTFFFSNINDLNQNLFEMLYGKFDIERLINDIEN